MQLILSACSPFFEKLFEEDDRAHSSSGKSFVTSRADNDSVSSNSGIENEKQCSRSPLVIVLPEVVCILNTTCPTYFDSYRCRYHNKI